MGGEKAGFLQNDTSGEKNIQFKILLNKDFHYLCHPKKRG